MAAPNDLSRIFRHAVDRNSPIPYYVQVKRALQEYIEDSGWQTGNQLPGEPELCRLFDVSRTVIRQALREMQYEGLIVKKKGKGTFVAEPKIVEHLFQNLTGFYQDMTERGFTPVTKVLKQELVPASSKVAGYLGLDPGVSVIQIHRLRSVEDVPIILDNTYLPYALCPKVLHTDLSSQSLYAFLGQEYSFVIARGRRTLEAVSANEYEASLLEVDVGSPLILLDSVSYLDNGTPVEYFHGLHRGDRSKFEVELVRVRHTGGVKEILSKDNVQLPQGSVVVDVNDART